MMASPRAPGRPENPALKSRRVAEILDVATTLFAEHGYAETQVQTLADTLGVGNGTIYRYFPTKEKLFLAAVERGLDDLTAEMDAVMSGDAEPLELLQQAVRKYLQFFHRHPQMAELFIQERAAFKQHHRPLYFVSKDDGDSKHEQFFQRLQASGAIRTEMSQARFFTVVGDLLYGTILTNLLNARTENPDTQAEAVLDLILNGTLTDAARKRFQKSKRRQS